MFLEFLLSSFIFIKGIIFSIFPFIILIGVLVFIHELGHFLVARFFGVSVEVFSLGFGPKIFQLKKGDTIYCISAIPLGGYVKMFGDDPFKPVEDSEKYKGFLYQKVYKKIAIALGGPLMNLLFTFMAFFFLALIGQSVLAPILGDIKKDTKAYLSGLRSGDRVLSISGNDISNWDDIKRIVQSSKNQKLNFKILSSRGKQKTIEVESNLVKNKNIFELKKEVGEIKGMVPFSKDTTIGISEIDLPAYLAGMRTFDQIVSIDNKKIKYWRDLEYFFHTHQKNKLLFEIKRMQKDGTSKNLKFSVSSRTGDFLTLSNLGIESSDLYIFKVGEKTPAGKAGLKKGDRLISINGESLHTWQKVAGIIFKSGTGNQPLSLTYSRDGEVRKVNISPKEMLVEGVLNEKPMIGIASGLSEILPDEKVKKHSFLSALAYGNEQTWKWCSFIAIGLMRLVQGKISFRTMGGAVTIGRVAYNSFHKGFYSFIFMMALISLNLFFFNILPIPLLDGGHILFFTIEGIMSLFGKVLDFRRLVIIQQFGFLFLILFFSLTLFNDLYNWLTNW